MKIGLFFQSFIPQGNGTDGNVNSGPSITEGLSWFEYLLFALFNHLQFGDDNSSLLCQMKEKQNIQNQSIQNQNIIELISQYQEQEGQVLDQVFKLQSANSENLGFQNVEFQNLDVQDEKSQDTELQSKNKQAELMLFLPFLFKIVQDKQAVSEEKGEVSSGIDFLNKEVLKDIALKGMPDEKHLIELAEKLNSFIKSESQLAENINVQDIKQEAKQLLAQIFNENSFDEGNKLNFSGKIHLQENRREHPSPKFFNLAFNDSENFQLRKVISSHTNMEKEQINLSSKEEVSQNFPKLQFKNQVEGSLEGDIVKGKNEDIKNRSINYSIEGKFLQAYFNIQKDFQPASLQQHFAMASKQNPQSFHRVHLNELAAFIKDFSVELLPEGEKMARLSLEPPELGRLDLEVKVKDKKVEIVAKVEKPEALHEIRQHLHHIKTHFEEAGLQLKEFQLSLAENLAGGGEFLADKKGEGRSSEREKKQAAMEIAGVENEAGETMPLINQKGSYYYIA